MPYGITIDYILNDYSNVLVNGAISGEAFYRNAIMLFSLIDNADVINCKIADKTSQYDGALYVLPYSRKMAKEVVGEDVRSFAGSTNTLNNLIDPNITQYLNTYILQAKLMKFQLVRVCYKVKMRVPEGLRGIVNIII